MTGLATLFAGLVTFATLEPAAPAFALIGITYLSATGSGAVCSRVAPCNSVNLAHAQTVENGTIVCLDSGDFASAGITKSITIDCTGTASSMGLIINGAGIVVTVRGVRVDGNHIDFQNGASLAVENSLFVYGDQGILFRPSNAGATLVVTDSLFTRAGSGMTGGAIIINPQPGGSARVAINRVTVEKSVFGIAVDGTGSTAGINVTISDSVSNGNIQDGIIAVTPSGGAPIGVMVKNTKSTNNAIGIRSIGPNVTVRVSNSAVIGNGTGVIFSGGGALLSFGNNEVQANGANGAFSGSLGLQ